MSSLQALVIDLATSARPRGIGERSAVPAAPEVPVTSNDLAGNRRVVAAHQGRHDMRADVYADDSRYRCHHPEDAAGKSAHGVQHAVPPRLGRVGGKARHNDLCLVTVDEVIRQLPRAELRDERLPLDPVEAGPGIPVGAGEFGNGNVSVHAVQTTT